MIDLILYIIMGITTIAGLTVFLSNSYPILIDLMFYISSSIVIIAVLTVFCIILYPIIKFIKIRYYMIVNLPITCFIKNLPDESYIIYENDDFFIRYIAHDLKEYSTHERIKIFEEFKLGEPITKDIPLIIRLKLIKLKEIEPKMKMIKTGNRLFIVEKRKLNVYHNDYAFDDTENPNKWFKRINKIL